MKVFGKRLSLAKEYFHHGYKHNKKHKKKGNEKYFLKVENQKRSR